MADIAEIKRWCEQARALLGRTGAKSRGKMKDRSDEVAKLLEKLAKIPTLAEDHARLKLRYERIAAKALQSAQAGNKDEVALASQELSLLKNLVRLKLAEAPNPEKAAAKDAVKALKNMSSTEKTRWAEEAVRKRVDVNNAELNVLNEMCETAGMPRALIKAYYQAHAAVSDMFSNSDWLGALDRFEPLDDAIDALRSAYQTLVEQKDAYFERFRLFEADYRAMNAKVHMPGLPKTEVEAFKKAKEEVGTAFKLPDWPAATLKLADLDNATKAVKKSYEAGKDYFDEYAKIGTEVDDSVAVNALKLAKLSVPTVAWSKAYNVMSKAAADKDWVKAKAEIAPFAATCRVLIKAGESALLEKPLFDTEFSGVADLPLAQTIAKTPPLTLVNAEVKTFREAYAAVNTARNTGEFKAAQDAIPALKTAIARLIEAKDRVDKAENLYKLERAKITDLETAQALAAANSPAVTAKVGAFNVADGAVKAKTDLQDWAAATPLLAALASATRELLLAKTHYNSGYTEEKQRLLQSRIIGFKPKTDEAAKAGPTSFIDTLKAAVNKGLLAIQSAVSSKDYAQVEVLLQQMTPDTQAMDAALLAYEQHLVAFNIAKNGPIKRAREFALTPPKLAKERDDALLAKEQRIEHFADKGSVTGKAEPMVTEWVQEAEAWKSAQAVSENLNNGAEPDANLLRTLESLPGGGKVLDALMAGLPEGKPEKFMKAALKQRFGVDVLRFEKKNKDDSDYTGLTAVHPDTPDKSLQKMYSLFCKVPVTNVKAKVSELIQFDEDAGGAAAGGSKIWMYCGQPKGGSQQKFGSKAGVVAEGESIEDEYLAANEDEIPYFDFAALHEVGHAVDAATNQMGTHGAIAGWQRHTPDAVAVIAARHFKYDEQFVKDTLATADSTPPTVLPPPKTGVDPADWDKAREAVVNWCKSVREGMSPWNNAALSGHIAIDGRVYQEAYLSGNRWVSYLIASRSKGITSYQFRAPGEWFAELYAAYFSGKLKKDHPYASWLKPLKKIS